MEQLTEEVTGEYRLNFNKGEPEWDDPIAPEVTSDVLGRRTGTVINRTGLLAWSLMSLPCVEMANLLGDGRIEIRVSTGSGFDELTFKFQVAELVSNIREIPAYRAKAVSGWRHGLRDLATALVNATAARPIV
jgi:hypothetical protein